MAARTRISRRAGELNGHYGDPPSLNRLDGNGNLAHAPDFRQRDATVLEDGWGADSASVLRSRYGRLDPDPLLTNPHARLDGILR
ncbi:MAG TPA: hypothetical protein VGC70_01925 [Burkholderiales bacterium]